MEIYTDSSSHDEFSVVSFFIPSMKLKYSRVIPLMDNNEAEAYAILRAVNYCRGNGIKHFRIRTDSESVIAVMTHGKCKNMVISTMCVEIKSALIELRGSIRWIPRQNNMADHLTKITAKKVSNGRKPLPKGEKVIV